ncbi:MAG: NADH-quinone oxidoreductase subunit NuoF [Roseibacillus sp.]|nr:NADH-quinone oxidoreductase subunit NuoF [Roseibacillus sp.]
MPKVTYIEGKEPHELERRLIFRNIDRKGWNASLKKYVSEGGYKSLEKSLRMEPGEVTQEVKDSGLRGRGGAGFPTGVKWGFIPPENKKPVYLICNCDESEPGTFKDRYIVHQDPHQLIEGMVISCFAVGAKVAYIYIREEFPEAAEIVEKAIKEAKKAGFLGKNICGTNFSCEFYVHRGAGAYICGEETGLIESLEGKRPYPRIKPPYFPAAMGLYMCPTIVNNVETLCHVKHIIEMGGKAYADIGTPRNTGTRILCVSGDVKKPGYYEIEVGKMTMGELLHDVCGGPLEGRTFKAVIPGGSSAKILRCSDTYNVSSPPGSDKREITFDEIPLDFDTMAACGSMAGSGGVIVMDDSRRMSWVLNNINEFYAHESCGQCTPCREGSTWMKKITDRLVGGQATPTDLDTLESVAYQIDGRTICAFGEACSWPVEGMIDKFRDELLADTAKDDVGISRNPEQEAQRRYLKEAPAPVGSS